MKQVRAAVTTLHTALSLSEPHDPDARRLLEALTSAGTRSLGLPAQTLSPGQRADFVAVDLEHPSVLGAQHPLPAVLMGAASAAITDVFVHGQRIVSHGRHFQAEQIGRQFVDVMRALR